MRGSQVNIESGKNNKINNNNYLFKLMGKMYIKMEVRTKSLCTSNHKNEYQDDGHNQ